MSKPKRNTLRLQAIRPEGFWRNPLGIRLRVWSGELRNGYRVHYFCRPDGGGIEIRNLHEWQKLPKRTRVRSAKY